MRRIREGRLNPRRRCLETRDVKELEHVSADSEEGAPDVLEVCTSSAPGRTLRRNEGASRA